MLVELLKKSFSTPEMWGQENTRSFSISVGNAITSWKKNSYGNLIEHSQSSFHSILELYICVCSFLLLPYPMSQYENKFV